LISRKTASVHQKQPPPNVATISRLLIIDAGNRIV
jgi:hypothetical protein